jgi:drug/metabolite transporter (DMT)-like permease
MTPALLWVPVTLGAALAQVLRNGAQAGLTRKIGTLGATQVRFVFGFPFALAFLAFARVGLGEALPAIPMVALQWCALGAVSQIAATALMLLVMRDRAFGVAYAYIKTEPVLVAAFAAVILHEMLPTASVIAVVIVTAGVVVSAVRPGDFAALFAEGRPALTGVAAGALFGLSAVAFRGAIESVPQGSFIIRSLVMLAISLGMQTALLGAWLGLCDRAAFLGSVREWRDSLFAGFLGALASAGWFTAFSLTAAANVRTLALVEIPAAALVSYRVSGRHLLPHEIVGFLLIAAGVALLVLSHHG